MIYLVKSSILTWIPFLLQSKSETTLNLKANQLLLEMTQERLVVVELSQLVAMKRDPLVFTQP